MTQHAAPASPPKLPKADPTVLLRNQTPLRIRIAPKDDPDRTVLHLSPYGEKALSAADANLLDLDPWLTRCIIDRETLAESPSVVGPFAGGVMAGVLGFGFWAVIIWGVWEAFWTPPERYWTVALFIMAAAGLLMAVSQIADGGGVNAMRAARDRILSALSSGAAFGIDMLNVGAVAAIAVGVPALVIYATGSWVPAPTVEAGSSLTDAFGAWMAAQVDAHPAHLTGRALQLAMIAVLASLPAALYFLFDRRKLAGLRQRFLRSVLFLDPDLGTIQDVESVYGSRVEEVLGSASRGGRRLPVGFTRQVMVPLTTLVMTMGWTLALDPVGAAAAGAPPLVSFFVPAADPLVFAFLGGYVFAITMLVRRYVRADLKPEALAPALVRILFAMLVAWAFQALWAEATPSILLPVAFLIGVFPQEWLTWLGEATRSLVAAQVGKDAATPGAESLKEAFPLGWLDGINIYHRSRLIDEGVDNLENLAHADLIDLLLETRLPLGTVVDWVDQAILILHTRSATHDPGHFARLREHGIRTATDLEQAWWNAKRRDKTEGLAGEEAALLGILGEAEEGPSRLRVILDALEDDQWMPQLRHARRSAQGGRMPVTADLLPHWDRGHEHLVQVLYELAVREDGADARRVVGAPAPRGEDIVGRLPIGTRVTDDGQLSAGSL